MRPGHPEMVNELSLGDALCSLALVPWVHTIIATQGQSEKPNTL